MKQPVAIRRDAGQGTKSLFPKRSRGGERIIIVPNDKEGQKNATKHASGAMTPSQSSEKVKPSKQATKDSTRSKDATKALNGTMESSHIINRSSQSWMTLFRNHSAQSVQVRLHLTTSCQKDGLGTAASPLPLRRSSGKQVNKPF